MNEALKTELNELAMKNQRYGYRRLDILPEKARKTRNCLTSFGANRIHRLYRQAGSVAAHGKAKMIFISRHVPRRSRIAIYTAIRHSNALSHARRGRELTRAASL